MANAHVRRSLGGSPTTAIEIERWCRPVLETMQRFVGIEPPPAALDTMLSTVLFTDIVGSTELQAELGDHAWKDSSSATTRSSRTR